jgi:hypothetical protein
MGFLDLLLRGEKGAHLSLCRKQFWIIYVYDRSPLPSPWAAGHPFSRIEGFSLLYFEMLNKITGGSSHTASANIMGQMLSATKTFTLRRL